MHDFKKKNKSWVYSNVVVVLLLIVVLFLWQGVWGVYKKEVISRENAEELREQEEVLKDRKAELEVRVDELQTDKGILREVREKFDVVKDGEQVVILIDPKATTTDVVVKEKGIFGNMWDSVINVF